MKRRKKRRLARIRFLALFAAIGAAIACLVGCDGNKGRGGGADLVPEYVTSGESGSFDSRGSTSAGRIHGTMHFLVLGEDRSGKLSDVIMLVSLNASDHSAAVIQIPRDTYARYTGRNYRKLNGADAYLGTDGFRSFLERNMGIRIDRHLILNLDAFSDLVDAVGGVEVDLPSDLVYDDPVQHLYIELHKGKQRLMGDTAEQFVRYRAGYVEADLGRMDAQKLFLAALIDAVRSNMTLPGTVRLVHALYGEVETDLTFGECCALLPVLLSTDLSDVTMTTLGGEAVRTEAGTWYYVLSRSSAEATLTEQFDARNFDPEGVFTDPDRPSIDAAYRKVYKPRNYRADEIRRDGLPIETKP